MLKTKNAFIFSTGRKEVSPVIGWYSETPLIRILGDQLNLSELEGFRIKGYCILLFKTN